MSIRPFNAVVQAVGILPRLGWPAVAAVVLLSALGGIAYAANALGLAPTGFWMPLLLSELPGMLGRVFAGPVLMLLALDRLAGRPLNLPAALRGGVVRYPLLLAITLVLMLPNLSLTALWRGGLINGPMLQIAMALIGIAADAFLTPLAAVLVVERKPIAAAPTRVLALNRGKRLPLAITFVICSFGYAAAVYAAGFGATLLGAAGFPFTVTYGTGNALVFGLAMSVSGVLSGVLYRRLCEDKGGVLESEVDEVFG